MNFKDAVQQDLASFFNLDEFAEIHNIDGRELSVVVGTDILNERSRNATDIYTASNGIYKDELVIYIKTEELGYKPVVEQHLNFDGHLYLVEKCYENMGVFEITLGANAT